ncbi:MAG TPA: PKD domain-containing protein, partial [Thermomicrobiaceae bacterium]|nr:PKD domain-containing protein [Thermomicrobiaceae bacterium]
AGYQEGPYGITDVRSAVADYLGRHGFPGATRADIIVSALHEHAAPSIQGLWGPPKQALPYLKQVAAATEQALEQAAAKLRPATITWGSVDAPWLDSTNIANANANEGWPNDGSLLALWARDAKTGQTIATYISEPAYPNIVYGPGDLSCPSGTNAALLSTDFPTYLQNYVERRFGGTAMVASGTLGDQPGPMQGDGQPSSDLPPVTVNGKQCRQTVGFDDEIHMGEILGNLVMQALAERRSLGPAEVKGTEQYILSPVYNPLLLAINNVASFDGGTPWTELGNPEAYPTDRSTSPPYEVGNLMGTWVTGLRLGNVLVLSMPGEFFPSIHQAWDRSIRGAAGVFVVGMGQDQLGYDFPAYAYPFTYYSADENLFNPSLTLGDQVVTAGEQDAQTLGFKANLTSNAEESALDNQYARVLKPGIQFMPFTQSGDLDPATHSFSPVLEGWATAQRFDLTDACSPPDVPSLPSCPLGQRPTIGPIHWSFGDGTTFVSENGAQNEMGYFTHSFCRAGTYEVTVTATDSKGQSDTFTLPVTVHPPLTVRLSTRQGRLVASPAGGDGHYLLTQWTLPNGDQASGDSVPVPSGDGTLTVATTDGTGTTTTVTATVTGGAITSTTTQTESAAGTEIADGKPSNSCP